MLLGGMSAVVTVLRAARLEQYAGVMEDQGFDDVEYLRTLSRDEERFREVSLRELGMRTGHAMRLIDALGRAPMT